ncbi:hypothetical protein SAMN05216251_12837 [Actinacidiphila alni]|uniref:Uncharacterized protein n=1 Tax=Actinacidiphila alni TaxID=380248 RepID=A0A1I2LJF0_9ACTN|nr:hypothetical protein [Actinacidiphila alni]SFF77186.1 hypothetical protein SAMN05216251_12837 [Actinacidiphila alni]
MTSTEMPLSVTEELRSRAGTFVNSHQDVWVTVEDDGELVMAADSPAVLMQAVADWLKEGPDYAVAAATWTTARTQPVYTLRLVLRAAPTA